MARLTSSTLSNCYVPLPDSSSYVNRTVNERQEELIATRTNGNGEARGNAALRRLCLETSILSKASGSALVELGHTKVLCRVDGPSTTSDSYNSNTNMDEGILQCAVKYAPLVGRNLQTTVGSTAMTLDSQHVSMGRLNSATMTLESELSSNLHSALLPSVPLEKFPKCLLRAHVTILQDDGSALSACIVAASLALADAHIELYDLVSSCTVAVLGKKILADPTEDELAVADATVILSVLPNWKEATLWQQSGRLSRDQASQAVDLCHDGCRTFQRFMRQCLVDSTDKKSAIPSIT